jgi:hypothetical protein
VTREFTSFGDFHVDGSGCRSLRTSQDVVKFCLVCQPWKIVMLRARQMAIHEAVEETIEVRVETFSHEVITNVSGKNISSWRNLGPVHRKWHFEV